MLTEMEQDLTGRNRGSCAPSGECLHELFEAAAARFPSEIAAMHGEQRFTYAELNARANQLAHYLGKHGVRRNSRVGIGLQRSLDFAVTILGVLKAGGTCVPLDPKYPGDRLTYMLKDVGAPLVITERGLPQAHIPASTRVLHLSDERDAIDAEPRTNPGSKAAPSDIAYIIYTSGSTGTPRGVLLHHAGLANYAPAAAEMFDLQPGDRMLQFCSISFDAALEEIYATWAAGATLVFRNDDLSLEPGEFLAWASKQQISVMDLPTAYWHEWVYAMPTLPEKIPSGLRLVIVGGEKASPEAYATWHKFAGDRVRWINTYGPAEASVVATAYEPELRPDDRPPAVLPIGRPVANARVYLLDEHLSPVPVGVPGEIHIGGVGVAQGYLNLPELTEQKFITDTFSDAPSARMYKTGDLAKYLPNGEIEFVGRRDNQVKIRGFRIEPGEIESILGKHAVINEAAVVLREDQPGDKRLVACVVRSGQGSVTEGELRKHVQKHLPEYMVPSEFVFLDSMPLTPNGKIDRRSLAGMKFDSPSTTVAAENPSDPVQAQLVKIWEEVLGRKSIGTQDNFFDLGGHSLLAARMMHRVKQTLGKTVPLAVLLQAPTIRKLAAVLNDGWERYWSSLVPIQPEGSKPAFFMVHGVGGNVVGFQELARQMNPDYPFYGLQSQGLSGTRPCHTSIEEMAAHYVSEIRTVQARGPYHLGGFSMGGLVAYEMARQFLEAGEEVGLLVLFDTYATKPKPANKSLVKLLLNPSWAQFKRLPSALRKNIRWRIRAARLPEDLKKVLRVNAQAADSYGLRPYPGHAILLHAGEKLRSSDDTFSKWAELAGSLEMIEIPGAHMDILREPHVSRLAERLKACIDGVGFGEAELFASNVG